MDDFENGIRDQLMESLLGSDFKKNMQAALSEFTNVFGVDLKQLPHELGKNLTKNALKAFGQSDIGKQFKKSATELGNKAIDSLFNSGSEGAEAANSGLKSVLDTLLNGAGGGGADAAKLAEGVINGGGGTAGANAAGTAATNLAAGMGETTIAMESLTEVAMTVAPEILIVVAALMILGPALEGLGAVAESAGKAFMKSEEIRQKRAENGQKRLQATVEDMVKKPFEILEEAATQWASTWDSNLRKVGQTQGYDKEAVYALYEGYADRLREDNLASVINATDIVDKLSTVLDTGLSGEAAEEFAYIATKLTAAIPNQDFFSYAETYASIAANAISQGDSQQQALAKANAELEKFASNLLYSSRELADGFTVGLKDGSSLFKEATQIAQSAKTYNAGDISGTLTSVSAIIGSVAPDLASALVDNVVQAAIGGNNNSQLVALRSLAGINAGNTEFLKEMANNPQTVFANLFSTLANMQNMSPDNYMEVAEGLADVFGIDKAAFARVDFNYLAQAISSMNTNNQSLEENLKLLESGQTTTSAEQLKAQEINSIILEEGLAYVIDSEAGRMIQQHMWDEQIANAQMEATYAVDLQGSALQLLEGIRETVMIIQNLANPVGFIANGVTQLTATIAESIGNQDDIAEILKLGAVGSNKEAFYNLTTVGKDLNLVQSLVEMMGGKKGNMLADIWAGSVSLGYGGIFALNNAEMMNSVADAAYEGFMKGEGTISTSLFGNSFDLSGSNAYGKGVLDYLVGGSSNTKVSRYVWGSVGKSVADALQNTSMNTTSLLGSVQTGATDAATQAAQEASNKKFQDFLDTAAEASKTMGYDAWVQTSRSFGISNFEKALETYGKTEEEIKNFFTQNQAMEEAQKEVARQADEQAFRDEVRAFGEDTRAYWDYSSGSGGIFQTAMWFPFFGDGQKYDTRMTLVDDALADIQARIGTTESHTVIGGIEELSRKLGDDTNYTVIGILTQIRGEFTTTFVSSASAFQKCLADWTRYIAESKDYTMTVSKSSAWSDLKSAEADQQTQATLALANALGVFSAEELKKMDPQLQTNALLGEIVILLQTIQQQNNTTGGGMSLIDSISALGFGVTTKT
jgi:hypothetical protein